MFKKLTAIALLTIATACAAPGQPVKCPCCQSMEKCQCACCKGEKGKPSGCPICDEAEQKQGHKH